MSVRFFWSWRRLCFYTCLSVIPFTGGDLPQCMLGYPEQTQTPPGAGTPQNNYYFRTSQLQSAAERFPKYTAYPYSANHLTLNEPAMEHKILPDPRIVNYWTLQSIIKDHGFDSNHPPLSTLAEWTEWIICIRLIEFSGSWNWKFSVKLLRLVKCSSWIVVSETFDVALTVLTYQRKSVWGPELLVIQLEDLLQPRLRLAAHKLSMIGKANEQKTSDTLSNLILKMYSFET